MPRFSPCLEVSPGEATNIFESIKASSQSDVDWAQVAADCHALATTEFVTWDEDEAWEDYGIELNWNEYWQRARGWAEAQLSPSEYRKMREADERDAAENRLKNYFFGGAWTALPWDAQERLISADVNWNSPQLMARQAILNDLLRAAEAMCYEFIWISLEESGEFSLEFLRQKAGIAEDQRSSAPSARGYTLMCGKRFFRDYLQRNKVADEDIEFITQRLPSQIRMLNTYRNQAEHEPRNTTQRNVIDDRYKTFLGIGKQGMLPELARIGRKLRGGRRDRR